VQQTECKISASLQDCLALRNELREQDFHSFENDCQATAVDDNVITDRNKSANSNNSDKSSSDFEEVCPWKSMSMPPVDLLKGVKLEGETWYFCLKCVTGIWVTTHDVSTHTKALESAELEKMKICNFDFYKSCMWISGWSINDNVITDGNKSGNSNNRNKSSSDFEKVCPWKSKPMPPVDLLKGVKWEGETWYFCPKCVTGIWVTTHDVSTHTKALESAELDKMKIRNFDFYKRCMWISGWLYTYKGKDT